MKLCGQDDYMITLEHKGEKMFLEKHYPPYHLWVGKSLHCFTNKACFMKWLDAEFGAGSIHIIFKEQRDNDD